MERIFVDKKGNKWYILNGEKGIILTTNPKFQQYILGRRKTGCTTMPALVCKGTTKTMEERYKPGDVIISKIVNEQQMKTEMEASKLFLDIDREQEYHIGNYSACELDTTDPINKNILEKCEFYNNTHKYYIIQQKDGGIDLNQLLSFLSHLRTFKRWISYKKAFLGILAGLLRLHTFIRMLQKNQVAHMEINATNIVCQPPFDIHNVDDIDIPLKLWKFKLIDLGRSLNYKKISDGDSDAIFENYDSIFGPEAIMFHSKFNETTINDKYIEKNRSTFIRLLHDYVNRNSIYSKYPNFTTNERTIQSLYLQPNNEDSALKELFRLKKSEEGLKQLYSLLDTFSLNSLIFKVLDEYYKNKDKNHPESLNKLFHKIMSVNMRDRIGRNNGDDVQDLKSFITGDIGTMPDITDEMADGGEVVKSSGTTGPRVSARINGGTTGPRISASINGGKRRRKKRSRSSKRKIKLTTRKNKLRRNTRRKSKGKKKRSNKKQ